ATDEGPPEPEMDTVPAPSPEGTQASGAYAGPTSEPAREPETQDEVPAEPIPEPQDPELPSVEEAGAEQGQEAAPPAGAGDPRLHSRDASQRREAVMALASEGVSDDDVPTLASLLQDPERGIRVLAVQTLAQRADLVDPEVIRQALRDPVDQVRAAGVRLASARSSADVMEVFAVVAERHWPLSQQAALDALQGLVERSGVGDGTVRVLL